MMEAYDQLILTTLIKTIEHQIFVLSKNKRSNVKYLELASDDLESSILRGCQSAIVSPLALLPVPPEATDY